MFLAQGPLSYSYKFSVTVSVSPKKLNNTTKESIIVLDGVAFISYLDSFLTGTEHSHRVSQM